MALMAKTRAGLPPSPAGYTLLVPLGTPLRTLPGEGPTLRAWGSPCCLTGAAGIVAPVSFWGALERAYACVRAGQRHPGPSSQRPGVSPGAVWFRASCPQQDGSLVSISGGLETRCWGKPSFFSGGG